MQFPPHSVDFIDLNAGCPIDSITDHHGGSALLRRTTRMCDVVRGMVESAYVVWFFCFCFSVSFFFFFLLIF
jgi:tRNA-dihydrouridine synthase